MILPTNISAWFDIFGSICSALGSMVLAWRVKTILQWVKYVLVSHEITIKQLVRIVNGNLQTQPGIEDSVIHLIDVENKLGLIFLLIGFILLAVGMLLKAASYFFI